MIGTPGAIAALAAAALVPLLGAGGPEPSLAIAARALVAERATAADGALAALERAIDPGLELARSGAARVVSGESPPGEPLVAAGELIAAAEPLGARASSRLRALRGALEAVNEAPENSLEPPAAAGELASIGAQVDGTSAAADRFAAMRLRADRVLEGLAEVMKALRAGDAASAQRSLDRARADHDAIASWDAGLVTLPVWVDASGGLLDAAEALVAVTADGDPRAAAEAAAAFARLRGGAASADRALRIAIGEGGSAVTAAPLRRLADVLRRTAASRAVVAEILHSVSR